MSSLNHNDRPKNYNIQSSSQPPQAAPHQMHSLVLLYSRLPALVILPPFLALAIPVIFSILNFIFSGHAIHFAITTITLWQVGILTIHHYCASSTTSLEKALRENEIRLPALAVTASAVMLFAVTRMTGDTLAWHLPVPRLVGFFVRTCFGIVLLEVGVFLRYFGPPSISTYPYTFP